MNLVNRVSLFDAFLDLLWAYARWQDGGAQDAELGRAMRRAHLGMAKASAFSQASITCAFQGRYHRNPPLDFPL